jgi:hypothetical protein
MLKATASIGIDRMAHWLRTSGFDAGGRYQDPDPMGGAGRIADWMEISCLLRKDDTLSRTTTIDHLIDSGMFVSKDKEEAEEAAEEAVSSAISEINRRQQQLARCGDIPFPFEADLTQSILRRTATWQEKPIYFFLLLASLGQLQTEICKNGTSHHEVGHLFEEITQAALTGLFGEPVKILPATGSGAMRHLSHRVEQLLSHFGRNITDNLRRQPMRLMDGELDIVARLNLGDSRPGAPHILVQCATGDDWRSKLHAPTEARWRDWASWRGPIYRAIAMPTAFGDDGTLENASRDGNWTLVIDRLRILFGLSELSAIPPALARRIRIWCAGRVRMFKNQRLIL